MKLLIDNRGLLALFLVSHINEHRIPIEYEIVNNQSDDVIVMEGDEIKQVWEFKIKDLYSSVMSKFLYDELYRYTERYDNVPLFCAFIEPDLSRSKITPIRFREMVHKTMMEFPHVLYIYEWRQNVSKNNFKHFLDRCIKYFLSSKFGIDKSLYPALIGKDNKNIIRTLQTLNCKMGEKYASFLVEEAKRILCIDNLTLEVLCDITIQQWNLIMHGYKGKKPCSANTLFKAIHGGK